MTPVQWLFEQINSDKYTHAFGKTYISSVFLDEALEMEKKQNEILNEEIEAAAPLGNPTLEEGFIRGAKWYK
jgi:hypothetical protein